MKKKNTGREYEADIKDVFNAVNKAEEIEHSEIVLNEVLPGKTLTRSGIPIGHEIDVNWIEQRNKKRTVVQAKDYSENKVKKSEMMAFDATVNDIEDSQGVFIAKGGFQEGALEWALAKGISASELREPTEEELKDRVLHIRVPVCVAPITFLGMKDLVLSQEWLDSLSQIDKQALNFSFAIQPEVATVKTKQGLEPVQLYKFAFNSKKITTNFEGTYESKLFFPIPVEVSGGGLPFPIFLHGFTYTYRVQFLLTETISIDADSPKLLRNVTGGNSYMIANINGEPRANKLKDLPPTKFTPAAEPKDGKNSKRI